MLLDGMHDDGRPVPPCRVPETRASFHGLFVCMPASGMVQQLSCLMESVWAPAILRAPRHGRRCSSHSLIHAAAHRHLSSLRRHVQRHLRPCPVAALRSDDPDDGHRPPFDPAAAAQASLRAVLALVAAVLLHLGGGTVSDAAQASVAEDKLLEFVRQVEVKLDGAVGAVKEAAGQV